jgi:hypothetical protein
MKHLVEDVDMAWAVARRLACRWSIHGTWKTEVDEESGIADQEDCPVPAAGRFEGYRRVAEVAWTVRLD